MENNNRPLVSVIIPTYNSEIYLSESINSILSQSYTNFEIIIIDDGSTDNTRQLITKFGDRVQYIYQEHMGISSALNNAIKYSSGIYLSFLDADDLWTSNKLKLQLSLIMDKPEIDMVFGHISQFISPELSTKETKNFHCPNSPMPGYSRTAMLIGKESYSRVGSFSEKYTTGEFIDWYLRAQDVGLKSYLLSDIVLMRRIHKNNTTKNKEKLGEDYIRLLKSSINRRRDKT